MHKNKHFYRAFTYSELRLFARAFGHAPERKAIALAVTETVIKFPVTVVEVCNFILETDCNFKALTLALELTLVGVPLRRTFKTITTKFETSLAESELEEVRKIVSKTAKSCGITFEELDALIKAIISKRNTKNEQQN